MKIARCKSVAELRLELEREQALAALAGEDAFEVARMLSSAIVEAAAHWDYLRADRSVLPDWWLRRHDPTQVDGRVRVVSVGNGFVDFETFDGASFGLVLREFVEAVLGGHVLDSA